MLARKFARDKQELARIAVFLVELADLVQPRLRIDLLSDEADNRILECAIAGRADVIVTGDRSMLDLGEFQGVRIKTLRRFLAS